MSRKDSPGGPDGPRDPGGPGGPDRPFSKCFLDRAQDFSIIGMADLITGGAGDALVSSGAAMAIGAGKNVVTYGRRTSTLTSLNLSGKGGLPEALSRGTWGKVLKVLPNTIALDPGFWAGDALSCLVSR